MGVTTGVRCSPLRGSTAARLGSLQSPNEEPGGALNCLGKKKELLSPKHIASSKVLNAMTRKRLAGDHGKVQIGNRAVHWIDWEKENSLQNSHIQKATSKVLNAMTRKRLAWDHCKVQTGNWAVHKVIRRSRCNHRSIVRAQAWWRNITTHPPPATRIFHSSLKRCIRCNSAGKHDR